MAKKPKKARKPVKIWEMYEGGKAKNRSCPKCGPAVFMAEHKDRYACGRCGYMEKK